MSVNNVGCYTHIGVMGLIKIRREIQNNNFNTFVIHSSTMEDSLAVSAVSPLTTCLESSNTSETNTSTSSHTDFCALSYYKLHVLECSLSNCSLI